MDARYTQNRMILQHLKEFGRITPALAIEEYGCYRLSARIHDLREQGHIIKTNHISRKNRFGHTVVFAEYEYKFSTDEGEKE